MKSEFPEREFCSIAVLILLLLSPVLATTEPSVVEDITQYPFGDTVISYTIVNPADSSIDDIVGFVIEVDYDFYIEALTTNGWLAQGLTNTPLNATAWDSMMSANYSGFSALTWRQFFGGIDYPFGQTKSVGFFVR